MKSKKIAISQRMILSEKETARDALEQTYVEYYQKFGILLIPVPNNLSNVEAFLDALEIEGIILSGGNDVDPKLYGGNVEQGVVYAKARDATEKALLDYALKKKLPVLCECRGTQFMNVYFGGRLLQDLSQQGMMNHVGKPHEAKIISKEAHAYFGKLTLTVNSYHRQGLTEGELVSPLRIIARAEDGVLEAIYHPNYPVAGIMWHPERSGADEEFNERLVRAFVNEELFWAPRAV